MELLRKNHVLERSYGYATLVEGGNGYSYEGENYDLRRARLENFAEKDRIAKYAASLIRPDDWVFLDNGTTVSRMTFYLPTDFEYTVLCYNFLILAELLKHSNIKVIFPGGYYHPEDYNFTSPEAVEFIRRHRANKAFLSVSGVHQSLGITCINANIVENNLTDFKKYLDDPNSDIRQYLGENGVVYNYNVAFSVYSRDADGTLVSSDSTLEDSDTMQTGQSPMESTLQSSITGENPAAAENFSQLMAGADGSLVSHVVTDSYDVLYGSWPQAYGRGGAGAGREQQHPRPDPVPAGPDHRRPVPPGGGRDRRGRPGL